jgi:hypothetical protein
MRVITILLKLANNKKTLTMLGRPSHIIFPLLRETSAQIPLTFSAILEQPTFGLLDQPRISDCPINTLIDIEKFF